MYYGPWFLMYGVAQGVCVCEEGKSYKGEQLPQNRRTLHATCQTAV